MVVEVKESARDDLGFLGRDFAGCLVNDTDAALARCRKSHEDAGVRPRNRNDPQCGDVVPPRNLFNQGRIAVRAANGQIRQRFLRVEGIKGGPRYAATGQLVAGVLVQLRPM